jgi:hypothetical protein
MAYTDFELAEDTKALLQNNPDVKCSDALYQMLMGIEDDAIVKVDKAINSPIEILSIEEVTDEVFAAL